MPTRDARPSREEIVRQDIRDLERLGYAQQLFREMGGFSNFAVSFSIISILTGAVLLFGYGLKFAGPSANSIGWPLVSLLTLCVAAGWNAGRGVWDIHAECSPLSAAGGGVEPPPPLLPPPPTIVAPVLKSHSFVSHVPATVMSNRT